MMEQESRVKDNRPFSYTVLVIAVIAIVLIVMAAEQWRQRQIIKSINIRGLSFVEEGEILDLAAIPLDSLRVADLDLHDVKRRVERHPFVKLAAASHSGANKIDVRIDERIPSAYLITRGNELSFVDEEGTILDFRFTAQPFDLPLLTGFFRRGALDSLAIRQALKVVGHLRNGDNLLYRNISELRLEAGRTLTLITTDGGTPILCGDAGSCISKVEKFFSMWNDVKARALIPLLRYIDLRWDNQIVVKSRP